MARANPESFAERPGQIQANAAQSIGERSQEFPSSLAHRSSHVQVRSIHEIRWISAYATVFVNIAKSYLVCN